MISNWIRLLGGMLTVRIRGAELERFLNICTQQRIRLYRMERIAIDEMRAQISLRDFYRLARQRKRTRCRVHILQRRGFPFLFHKMRRRYALWVGLLLMSVVCYELSARVWIIQTTFPQGVDGYAVLEEMEQLGIGIGTKSASIDAHAVKIHMMTTLDDLSFFALNIDGNTLSVETAAATPTPEVDENKGVRDIVAVRDGVIVKQVIRRGTEKYKLGDAVLAGTILVDALVEPKGELGTPRLVDANADIWASTRYYKTRKMALTADKKNKTGASKTRYAICFGKTRINLYFGSSLTQGNCDRIISIESVQMNDHLVLPVSLYRETITCYTTQPVTHDAQEMQARLEYGVRRAVSREITEGNISSMQADLSTDGDAAVLHAVVWCYEQIGEAVEDGRTEADLPQTQDEESEETQQ